MAREIWEEKMKSFMSEMRFDAEDMARLCGVSRFSIDSWRTGRSAPRPKRMKELESMMDFLVERRRSRADTIRIVEELRK